MLNVQMCKTSPAVYLDHWALRTVSENSGYSSRFISALQSTEGTLCISWINLAEFNKMCHPRAAELADEFLDNVFPRIILLECDPFSVIEAENRIIIGESSIAPYSDLELLRQLAFLGPNDHLSISVNNLIQSVRQGGSLEVRMRGLCDVFRRRIHELREEAKKGCSICKGNHESSQGNECTMDHEVSCSGNSKAINHQQT